MTVIAGGCNHQAGFKETPAMNTLGIVFHDIVFGYIVYPGHNFTLFVTFSTEVGYIHFVGAGLCIAVMQDIVMTVTLLAAGSVWIIF